MLFDLSRLCLKKYKSMRPNWYKLLYPQLTISLDNEKATIDLRGMSGVVLKKCELEWRLEILLEGTRSYMLYSTSGYELDLLYRAIRLHI